MTKKQHQGRLGWLITLTVFALTLWSCVQEWPHYNVSAPGAYVTDTFALMRLTLGERVHLPLADGAELTAVAVCYHPEPGGNQPCGLIVNLLVQEPMNIAFAGGPFIARDPSDHAIRFDAGASYLGRTACTASQLAEQSWCTAVSTRVHLAYEAPPRQIVLLVPDVIINDEAMAVPPITLK